MGRDTGADQPTRGGVDGKGNIGRVDGGSDKEVENLVHDPTRAGCLTGGGSSGLDGKGCKKVDHRDKASGLSAGGLGGLHVNKALIHNTSNPSRDGDIDIDSGASKGKNDKKVDHFDETSGQNVGNFGGLYDTKAHIPNTSNPVRHDNLDIDGSGALQDKGDKKIGHLNEISGRNVGEFGGLCDKKARIPNTSNPGRVCGLDIDRSGDLQGKGDKKVDNLYGTSGRNVGGFGGVGGGRYLIPNTNNPDKVGDLDTSGKVDGLGINKSGSLSGKGGKEADTLAGHHAKVGGPSGDGARDGSDGLNGKGGEGIGNLVTHPSKADC